MFAFYRYFLNNYLIHAIFYRTDTKAISHLKKHHENGKKSFNQILNCERKKNVR